MGNLAAGNHRLTKYDRERLKKNIISHKFDAKKFEEHEKAIASLAAAVYNSVLSDKDQALIASLPKGWIGEHNHIYVNWSGNQTNLSFNGDLAGHIDWEVRGLTGYRGKTASVTKPIPQSLTSYNSPNVRAKGDIEDRIRVTIKEVQDFNKEIKTLSRSVGAVLSSVTTTNRLKEVWPESKPFVDALFKSGKPQSTAVALPINDLNQKLGLPVP